MAGQKTLAQLVSEGLAYLKTKAKIGKDVDDYIDWTLDNAEEPQNAAMIHALRSGATFDQLLTFDPEIAQNPVLSLWFREFYRGLFEEINGAVAGGADKGDATRDPIRPNGNAGDTSGNARAVDTGQRDGAGDRVVGSDQPT